jgi:transcriptional regulator with XRE-family HTH domain
MTGALARRLEELEKNAGVRASEVAQMLGTTPQTVSRWRSGRVEPQQERLQQLLALAFLAEELAGLYSPEEARLWLFTPHKLLRGESPAKRIQAGKITDVIALIAQLKDGAYV